MFIPSTLVKSAYLLILIIFLASCEKKEVIPTSGDPVLSIEYLIFGHIDGFCMKCDVLYKIEAGQLYSTHYQQRIDVPNPQFTLLDSSHYELACNLITEVPADLLNEKTETVGSYFPDVGRYYIEIKKGNSTRHWFIEGKNVPDYLQPFINDMNIALVSLQ